MKKLSVVLVDGFNISLDLSKGVPVQIEVPDDYEVKEGEDAFFNENIIKGEQKCFTKSKLKLVI